MSEAFEKGLKLFGEVYGEDQANGLRAYVSGDSDGFGKLQAQWAMEWAFGTILDSRRAALAQAAQCWAW
jgi:hypothetical protein